VGIGLSIFFYGLCCLVGLLSMIVNSAFPEMSVPSSARLLPLGAGLTVTENTGSCGGGSATFCDRWIHIHRAAQVSEQDVLQQMPTKLTRQYGFDLISDGAGWAGCTDGSQRLCGEVDPDKGGVVIVLEASDECSVEEICETPPFSFGSG